MHTSSRSAFLSVLFLSLALASCDDDGTTPGVPADTTPPAVSSITPVDAGHIDVTFSENVTANTAELTRNYTIEEMVTPLREGAAAPGDTLRVGAASLGANNRTVTLSLIDFMDAVNYEMRIRDVSDAAGNEITSPIATSFTGTDAPDTTPPQIVSRAPAPGATGVGLSQGVTFDFSEPVVFSTVESGATWAVSGGGAAVPFQLATDGLTRYAMGPDVYLTGGTQYTVSLTGVEDYAGNVMPVTSWSFTTTNMTDNTPPTVVSTVPAHGATHVNVNSNLSITFSEAVNQLTFRAQLAPDVGDGVDTWSNGGRTVTFDPDAPLAPDQPYTLSILPGDVEDLAGNPNSQIVNVVFSTGSTLPAGSFAGTIAGHPGTASADPTGAVVGAADRLIFDGDDLNILGSDVVAGNNTYSIANLPDGVYYPLCVKDSNGDGEIDPSTGDAVGLYGIDFVGGDLEPDSLTIAGGNHISGVNFPLYDTSAITGTVTYNGSHGGDYLVYVGVFDVSGFDPTQPPDYGTVASWPPQPEFFFNAFDDGLADGSYYVAAFLDVNFNSVYDPATDPAGAHGGAATPTQVDIANGSDAVGLVISLHDPAPAANARPVPGVAWPAPARRAPWLAKLSEAIRTQQE